MYLIRNLLIQISTLNTVHFHCLPTSNPFPYRTSKIVQSLVFWFHSNGIKWHRFVQAPCLSHLSSALRFTRSLVCYYASVFTVLVRGVHLPPVFSRFLHFLHYLFLALFYTICIKLLHKTGPFSWNSLPVLCVHVFQDLECSILVHCMVCLTIITLRIELSCMICPIPGWRLIISANFEVEWPAWFFKQQIIRCD